MVENLPGHNAMLLDPRFNVMGIGITYTDGNWQTSPSRYTMWGVVNFFGYTTLPAGTITSPGGGPTARSRPRPPACAIRPSSTCRPHWTWPRRPSTVLPISCPSTRQASSSTAPPLGAGLMGQRRSSVPASQRPRRFSTPDWDRDGVYDLLTQWTDGRLTLHSGLLAEDSCAPVTLGAVRLGGHDTGSRRLVLHQPAAPARWPWTPRPTSGCIRTGARRPVLRAP